MITNITLENFKCFRHVSINPKLLTVLIGPNGTGKSSILQALLVRRARLGPIRGRPMVPELLSGKSVDISNLPNPADGAEMVIDFAASILSQSPDPFATALETLRYVPAARGLVRERYHLGDNHFRQIPTQPGLGDQEEQLATNLVYSRPSEESLSKLLRKVTGTGLLVETVPSQSVEIKSVMPSGTVNIVAEGFGANALIQLLHQLLIADKGATVLIEEPEIHLHPKAQAELAEVLAETAKAEDKQIIMTTHSEHLVERLLLLVAEGMLTSDHVAIYSFSKDDKGECFATEIEVTENGQVEGGLTDFYANNLDTLDRRVKALKRSQ